MPANKRPSATILNPKTSIPSKRSQLNETNPAVTHTGSPVNPFTAKALASKLNERNMHTNGVNKTIKPLSNINCNAVGIKEMPVPPLISLQIPAVQHYNDMENNQLYADTDMNDPTTFATHNNVGNELDSDLNLPTFSIYKNPLNGFPEENCKDETNTEIMSLQSGSSNDDMNQVG